MRRITLAFVLIVAAIGSAHAADAAVTVVGGIDFGFKSLHLDPRNGGNAFNASFTTVNPNVALAYQSFYAALSYDKSISADSVSGNALVAGFPTSTLLDFARKDSTFTLGYRLNESFGVFVGYTNGVSEFRQTAFSTTLIVTDIDYSERGPFAGLAYTKAFANKGSLGLSVAYAKLDSEFKTVIHPNVASNAVNGDNTGLSYGLTWSGALTGSLGYRVGVKAIRYKMKDPGDITEDYTDFFVGITNYF